MSKEPPSDQDLFRRSVGPVRRLPTDDRVAPHRTPRSPHPKARELNNDVAPPMPERERPWNESLRGDVVDFHRPGIQRRALRRLRRGQWRPDANLDLHGKTAREAEPALYRFLARCQGEDIRCIRIVHGKGISSPGGRPVLKARVITWLKQHPEVNAFCSAPASDGGTGAMYVLLRARRE
ncbi:MAG: Smr/MutS family protein [Pseudomonadota bacterium]